MFHNISYKIMLNTLEDIYNLYEFEPDEEKSILIKNKIGNNECQPSFTRKMYIKPFDKCPICYDEIIRKKDAYLTQCGHAFHKKCIFNSYVFKQKNKKCSNFKCPLCRISLGTDIEEINERYNIWNGNELDNLENFWHKKDFIMPHICPNGNHWYGMNYNKNCKYCKEYCKNGLK